MHIDRVISDVIHEGLLLLRGQSVPDTPVNSGLLRNFRHYTIGRILPDNVVPYCHPKRWMQKRVNVVHRGDGKLLVIDEMKIILQDIRIFDINEFFFPKSFRTKRLYI